MNLKNKVVLIPGASRPIGRAVAVKFAQEGAKLVVPVFEDWPESTIEMENIFSSSGYTFLMISCDLRVAADVANLVSRIEKEYGELHFLINNIERGGMPIVHGSYDHEHNRDQWELEINTTLKAKWNLFHFSQPLLKRSGQGAVTNISSIAALTGRSGPVSLIFNDGYSAANRGIASLTETWAREAAPAIRVNEVMLGLIRNRHAEHTRGWSLLSESQRQNLINHTLLERTGTPQEVADLIYFITVEASYMTGSIIRYDGGYCLGGESVLSIPAGDL
jgi:3-oxoacyl-[acyl-carrier protein] reductase